MGQYLSAFKNNRAIHIDAQQSKDDLPSIFTEATSEDFQINLSLECEKGPINLAELPTEIILEIVGYLAPSGQISLSYSCRQIRKKTGASLAYILGEEESRASLSGSALSVESRNIRSLERLELRSMLDRDGRIPSLEKFCVGCEAVHCSSLFPISSLIQVSTERLWTRCLGTTGRVWICPHQTIDYDQAANSKGTAEYHRCENNFISKSSWRSGRYDSVDLTCFTTWPIMIVRRECVPSKRQVKEALGPLDAPVCPHLRLNDARIAKSYPSDCQRLRCRPGENGLAPDCGCWSCSSKWRFSTVCDLCGTQILFWIKPYANSYMDTLYVILRRTIQDVRSPTDRSWICQVADPVDFETYERAWHATSAECWKKVGSVYEDTPYEVLYPFRN